MTTDTLDSAESPAMPPTAKQEARKILDRLPDDATLEQIQYHLHVLQRIEEGRRAAGEGRTLPHDEVVRRMAKWLDD